MQPNNDFIVEDQSDEDGLDNHNVLIYDFIYQIDSSSLHPIVDIPLNDSFIQENND